MNPLISIIIPVYNIEEYIENCLCSLINQTYEHIEIICIDDGSTDSSADIIKAMQEKDSRIVYVYQNNSGVSSARNKGLDIANGEYIMFVDGDDYAHFRMAEYLLDCIEKTGANIVFADYTGTAEKNAEQTDYPDYSIKNIPEENVFDNGLARSVWSKIFRRSALEGFYFPEGINNGEDFCFMLKVLHADSPVSVPFVERKLYYYYQRNNSASFNTFSEKNLTEIKVNEMNVEYFQNKEDCFYKRYSLVSLFRALLYLRTKSIGSAVEKQALDEIRRVWKTWHKIFWRYDGISAKDKIMYSAFYYSRHLYELARMIKDPTMRDFYKQRKLKGNVK